MKPDWMILNFLFFHWWRNTKFLYQKGNNVRGSSMVHYCYTVIVWVVLKANKTLLLSHSYKYCLRTVLNATLATWDRYWRTNIFMGCKIACYRFENYLQLFYLCINLSMLISKLYSVVVRMRQQIYTNINTRRNEIDMRYTGRTKMNI